MIGHSALPRPPRFAATSRAAFRSRPRLALGLEIALGAAVVLAAGLPALRLLDRLELLGLGVLNGHSRPLATAAGLGVALLLFAVTSQLPGYRFAATLQHELSHLVAAMALGARPRRLEATAAGTGRTEVELAGPLPRLRGFLVAIAPYWFSPLLGTALSVAVSVTPSAWGRFAGALLLGWALWTPLGQTSLRQPDLRRYGVAAPLAASLWLWAAAATCGLAVLSSGRFASVGATYRSGWTALVGWLS